MVYSLMLPWSGVSDSSKLQIQKQITTHLTTLRRKMQVFPIVQSYKFKSKSQRMPYGTGGVLGVSDSSKLQIQKQITTVCSLSSYMGWVFPIVQSYKFKSKSQLYFLLCQINRGVSDSSKLQIQKQITTFKALQSSWVRVFPIVQSYKFKSKSQQYNFGESLVERCFR